MNILYLSSVASNAAIEEARKYKPNYAGYAVQKFNRLVVEGLAINGHRVTALSTFHLPGVGYGYRRRNETINNVRYRYIASPNYKPLRHVWLIVFCFCRVFLWGMFGKKNKVLMADVLNISACIGAVAAARIIGLRRLGIMTDMPGLMVNKSNSVKIQQDTRKKTFRTKTNKSFLSKFTHYVFLTEQMNSTVNLHHRPYIVMEGLVDADMQEIKEVKKNKKRVVLYAGGLHERYGLKMLVEAFLRADISDAELWLYGSGPFAEILPDYSRRDSRIVYKGIRPNKEVVEAELSATLLVNPRPTHEEFTQYSFPSKNMEYMVSGTPLLTTKLPGMPLDYYPYIYLFDKGEDTEGYAVVLKEVLSLSSDELRVKGAIARKWVLDNKNHIKQTGRIIELLFSKDE